MKYAISIGALNVDYQFEVDRYPRDGETLLARAFWKTPGGKGANQAGACARSGTRVAMVGAVGADTEGAYLVGELEALGVDCSFVQEIADAPTAMAFITVDNGGNNTIITFSAATQSLQLTDDSEHGVKLRDKIRNECGIVLAHAETPRSALTFVQKHARAAGIPVILTPAPTDRVDNELLEMTDVLVANVAEVHELTGMPTDTIERSVTAVKKLLTRSLAAVVLTLGADGALLCTKDPEGQVTVERAPAYHVLAVDTTGCGDAFAGTLGAAVLEQLADGASLPKALRRALPFASAAGALTATKRGTLRALPSRAEVQELMRQQPDWALSQVTF